MLSGGHLQSGPRATQNSTVTFSSGAQQPNASSDLPIFLYPLDVTNSPPFIYPFTPSSTAEACTPRNPPQSYVYGPFRAWRVLAEGGFGRAIVAQDLASQRLLCLKVFRRDRMWRKRDKENLFTELAVYKHIAAWRLPNTIFLMELEMSFQTKDHICFAMDLMAGDLYHFLTRHRKYCRENASRWSAQMALGISALHEMGIIHRDIKAENILIDIRENVKIADFGLSYISEVPLNLKGKYLLDVRGTIYCMAPEILCYIDKDTANYGPPADWWSFGCVLYELASKDNMPLFETENAMHDFLGWKSGYKSFPKFKALDISVADLVVGLLEPEPSKRHGFKQVKDHKYFKKDGTSEFFAPCARALQRAEQPDMLPDLEDEHTQTHVADIWCPRFSWRSPHTSNVDWRKPQDGGGLFPTMPSNL